VSALTVIENTCRKKKGRTSRPEINDSVVPPSPLQVLLFSFEDFVGSAAALLLATIFQTEAELKKVKCESQPVKFGKNYSDQSSI